MPAVYFYHLAFELRSQLLSGSDKGCACSETFIPKGDQNIFSDTLPIHRSSSWASYIAPRRSVSPDTSNRRDWPANNQHRSRDGSSSNRAAHTSATAPQRSLSRKNYSRHRDWREANITIEAVDMKVNPDTQSSLQTRPLTRSRSDMHLAATGLATKGKYAPSSPNSTDLGYGVVHLYRDQEPAISLDGSDTIDEDGDENSGRITSEVDTAYIDNECTTLCVLAVPSYMTPSDLLGWVGEDTREHVSHFRLVRTSRSNRYMVLMKFRESKRAKEWQRAWNGKLFNVMEPENCHVVFVKSIQFQIIDQGKDPSSFPDISNDPFIPTPTRSNSTLVVSDNNNTNTEPNTKSSGNLSIKPAPPLLELPTCPVCLERMDDTTGLATIFCQHVFHCACLQKWRGSGCPVCRYTQNELTSKLSGDTESQKECKVCGASENLWICLICGHLGCGRYDEAHAFAHFEHTNHNFAMDISTQHIWNYVGDEYVHRLIQNKADGKLVELPGSAMEKRATDHLPMDKLENMSQEYTQLLQSQLDSQRTYFEEQVERAVDKASKASAAAEQAAERAVQAYSRLEALEASNTAFAHDTLPSLERDRDRAERKAYKLESTTRQLQKEWNETKVINESLMDRIAHLEKQLEETNLKNGELEEQNRDLSFFISGMEKLKDQGDEIKEGTVSVPDPPKQGNKKKKKKSNKGSNLVVNEP